MKNIYKLTILFGVSILVLSCHNNATPNYQYFPNMYEPLSYNTYSESSAFKNGKEGQLPAEGSIKRGFVPYEYPNTPEALIAVKAANLKSPIDSMSTADMDKGKALFEIYCAICHGNAGNGQGRLVTQGKFLGVPSYKDRVINEGSIFHVVTYGLNLMGSHANQLSAHERWLVAAYVVDLKSKL